MFFLIFLLHTSAIYHNLIKKNYYEKNLTYYDGNFINLPFCK
ncbi:hypothetical protein KADA111694_05740 [Kaistella daneshvariae]